MNCESCTHFVRTTAERGVCRWATEVRTPPFWFKSKPYPVDEPEREVRCDAWARPGRRMKVAMKGDGNEAEVA